MRSRMAPRSVSGLMMRGRGEVVEVFMRPDRMWRRRAGTRDTDIDRDMVKSPPMAQVNRLWEQMIRPEQGDFSPEHARYILSLGFTPDQHARYEELSTKVQGGGLSEEESAELDELLAANDLLTILKAKARTSLRQHTPAA